MTRCYLHPALVKWAFQRLSPKEHAGKKHLERTSGIMYFLAFDRTVKQLSCCPIDCNPNTLNGKNTRTRVQLEFARLVQLSNHGMELRQVTALGEIESGGKGPEKRISSNFLTVPLKKASESARPYTYPNRPAPVLKMGMSATGCKWGIAYHDDWESNFSKFLTDLQGNTPFTDLAVFACRNCIVQKDTKTLKQFLLESLSVDHTKAVAEFWFKRISAEAVFHRYKDELFQSTLEDPFADNKEDVSRNSDPENLKSLGKGDLIYRIGYLENLLSVHEIEYDKLR